MRILLIHQYDPTIHNVGGIGTFIKTFIKYAPSDLEVDLLGVTAEPERYPVGRWHRLKAGQKDFNFFPLVAAHPIHRGRIPLNIRLTLALRKYRPLIDFRNAIIELHRIEPASVLRDLKNPKVLFLHAHSMDLYNPHTEVVWKKCPWLYFWLERQLIQAMNQVFIVREDAVDFYRKKYPRLAERVSFLPTWSDDDIFVSLPEEERIQEKKRLAQLHGFNPAARLLLFVGRFEGQKDPLLLLESFRRLNGSLAGSELVMIGEGTLETKIRNFISQKGLGSRIRLVGPQPQSEIARWMNAADAFVLSSAFEGMPRVVVEALQCGLPVVATDAGEAKRLVAHPSAGRIVTQRTPSAFNQALQELLNQKPDRRACQSQAAPFTAGKILQKVYSAYRQLGKEKK